MPNTVNVQTVSPETLRKLAEAEPKQPVLSVHLNTDPRDPINTSSQPGWQIDLRNGLARVGAHIEEQGDRDTILAFREFPAAFEERLVELVRTHPGRALSAFTTLDGSFDEVVISQLPLRSSSVLWEDRPALHPLWELADRGRALGVVAVDGDEVVAYRWHDGRMESLDDASGDLDDWRDELPGGEGRAPRFRSHEQQMDSRAEQHARRFLLSAGHKVISELNSAGVAGIVLVAAPGVADDFTEGLGHAGREQVLTTVDAHLTGLQGHELAERLENTFDRLWRERGEAQVSRALGLSESGGSAATGVNDVLDALTEHRVEAVIVSAELTRERLLQQAVETGAEISVLPDHEPLEAVGGAVAILRW